MLIHITRTVYGHAERGIIRPKTPADPPFEVSDAIAARLMALGIAEAVRVELPGSGSGRAAAGDESVGAGAEDFEIPAYSVEMTKAVLQSIASDYGVEVAADANKAAIVKALDDYFADALGAEAYGV